MKEYTNVQPRFAHEFFGAIAKSSDKAASLKEYGVKPPLNFLLAMNYDERVEFDLPEGMPPHKDITEAHQDLYAPMASSIRRILMCLKSDTRLPRYKKENVFIELIESLNPEEANILVFAKDRALIELYPWLTREFVQSVFPDYVHSHSNWKDKSEK
jgi:hypothetical protein